MSVIKKVFPYTVPVMLGYVVLGLTFGFLTTEMGLPHWAALVTSIFVYTGSLQFVMISMLAGPVSLLNVAAIALSMNTRHLFYSLGMLRKYHGAGAIKPYLIHALSDETFALLVSMEVPEGIKPTTFYFAMSFMNQMYWVLSSWIGALIGSFVKLDTSGMDFVLTALLISLFTEQWLTTKEHRPALTGLFVTLACVVIFGRTDFILPAMGIILAVLFALRSRIEKEMS